MQFWKRGTKPGIGLTGKWRTGMWHSLSQVAQRHTVRLKNEQLLLFRLSSLAFKGLACFAEFSKHIIRGPVFPWMSSVCSSSPSKTPHSFSPPLVCEFLSLALLFLILTEPWPGFLQNIPQSGFVWCFSHVQIGIRLWKEYPRGEEPFLSHPIRDYVIATLHQWRC